MPRPTVLPIPLESIPEGVKLCIENCNRLKDDADSLLENKRYHSAIVNYILAKGEFAKVLLLLHHYKKNEAVPEGKANQYFSDHKIHLEEFKEFYHESLPMSEGDQSGWRSFWKFDNDEKKGHMYVHWQGGFMKPWIYPNNYTPVPGDMKREIFEKMTTESAKHELEFALESLPRNPYFAEIMELDDPTIPTRPKLLEIIRQCTEVDNFEVIFDLSHRELKFELKRRNLDNPELSFYKLKQEIGKQNFSYKINYRLEDDS